MSLRFRPRKKALSFRDLCGYLLLYMNLLLFINKSRKFETLGNSLCPCVFAPEKSAIVPRPVWIPTIVPEFLLSINKSRKFETLGNSLCPCVFAPEKKRYRSGTRVNTYCCAYIVYLNAIF